jgi:two-component system, NarL family, sensor kinase
MRTHARTDGRTALWLAALRATLVAVIVVSEQLVDARQLVGPVFYIVLGLAAGYSLAALAAAMHPGEGRAAQVFVSLQPAIDLALLSGLAYASGGAFSDVRKAFFVVPLAAAFSERPRTTAKWSVLAVVAFSLQAALAGGHPSGTVNDWQRLTLNQDLYLGWAGAAGTMLAFGLRRRTAHVGELARSRQQLVAQSIVAVERERTRLAGALHDSPVQNLIAARHDLREEIFKLHPHVLDHVGLGAALEQVARRHAAPGRLEIEIDVDPQVGHAHQEMLFAFGRELLGNAARHASASRVTLALTRVGQQLILEVADDGCGIPAGRLRQALLDGHVGLAAISERVSALGGELTIAGSDAGGTRVRVLLPEDARGTAADGQAAVLAAHLSDRLTPGETLRVSTT